MIVTYLPLEPHYPQRVNKYGYDFVSGESVDVEEVEALEKFEKHPLFSVAKEIKGETIKSTAKDLRKILDDNGIKYKSNLSKPELQSLVDQLDD